jgi:hypothetical protein
VGILPAIPGLVQGACMDDVKTAAAEAEVHRLDVQDHLVAFHETARHAGIRDRAPQLAPELDGQMDHPIVRVIDGDDAASPELKHPPTGRASAS